MIFKTKKNDRESNEKVLVNQIDEKIQALNLLKNALQEDPSRKPEILKDFNRKFQDLL